MKAYHIALLAVLALLPSCVHHPAPRMVRTTITRPIITERFSASGGFMSANGIETVTTEMPYESPAYKAAGEALFSNP